MIFGQSVSVPLALCMSRAEACLKGNLVSIGMDPDAAELEKCTRHFTHVSQLSGFGDAVPAFENK